MRTTVVERYLHGQDDEYSDLWPYPGQEGSTTETEKAQDVYSYSLYEVKVTLEVDLDTGKSRILRVNDSILMPPQEWG